MEINRVELGSPYADLTRYPTEFEVLTKRLNNREESETNTVRTIQNFLKVGSIAGVSLSAMTFIGATLPILFGPFAWNCFVWLTLLILAAILLGGSAWRR